MKPQHQITTRLFIVFTFISCVIPVALKAQYLPFNEDIPEPIRESKQVKRIEDFCIPRTYPNYTFPHQIYTRELEKEMAKASLAVTSTVRKQTGSLDQLTWQCLGPTAAYRWQSFWSGRVRGLAVHPTNPDIVYIGAASGGLWKSTNGGESWADLSGDFACCTFGAISIDPNNPNTVYAGTGEAIAGEYSNIYDGHGLFKSTDGGDTWQRIGEDMGPITHFASLTVSPHDSKIVYAGIGGGYSFNRELLQNRGIWKSSDSGLTWKRTFELKNSGSGVYDILVDPEDPMRVYAAVGSYNLESGFYVSSDGGETWEQKLSGLPENMMRSQITQSQSNPSVFYIIIWDYRSTPLTNAYKSYDKGDNWVQISADHNFGFGTRDQGFYDLCIAVNPADENHVIAGNIDTQETTDGENFTDISGPDHIDVHRIVFSPSDPNVIYIGCDGGIYRSTDGGLSYQHLNNGLTTLQLYGIGSHPTDKNEVTAGSQDNDCFMTEDGGATPWRRINLGGDIGGIAYDPDNPSTLYALCKSQLWKTPDSGETFSKVSINFGSYTLIQEYTFCMHPQNSQWLYVPSTKLWRSTDGGENWTALTGDIFPTGLSAMGQSTVNPEILIVSTTDYYSGIPKVMVSTDGGFNWSEVSGTIPGEDRWISRMVPHPYEENTFFMVRSGYGSGKVYRTTDLGDTWADVSGNLPDIPHSDLFIDPENTNNYFAANDFGVYGSQDAGNSWTRLGNGMPFVVAVDFDYFSYGGDRLLRIATYGRGVFETDLSQIGDWSAPQITFDNPLTGEKLLAGSQVTLNWNEWDNTGITNVKAQISLDDGHTWDNMPNVEPGDETVTWSVPLIQARKSWIKILAKDAEGNSGEARTGPFVINRPPVLISIPDTTIMEDTPFQMVLNAEAIDAGDTLRFFDDSPLFDVNIITGGITFTPVNDNVGIHGVQVWASDGLDADTAAFQINILNTNDAPELFELINPPDGDVLNCLRPVFNWQESSDVDLGDTLRYYIRVSKDSVFSSIDEQGVTGEVEWMPDTDLEKSCTYYWDVAAADLNSAVTFCCSKFYFEISESATGVDHFTNSTHSFQLFQNYPNPFNAATRIVYDLPRKSKVILDIYNSKGQRVATLVNEYREAGTHAVIWQAKDIPTGLYLMRLEMNGQVQIKKCVFMK